VVYYHVLSKYQFAQEERSPHMDFPMKIFSGRSNEPLARAIVQCLDQSHNDCGPVALGSLDPRRNFSDGELYARYAENIRGADVFIVQSTNQPDTNLLELFSMIDTARSASAKRITAVIPYYGYARQDWKDKSRAPVTTVLIARLLQSAGVDRVVLLDVHSNVTVGAFQTLGVPVDHLWVRRVFLRYFREHPEELSVQKDRLVVAAPDISAGKYARKYAESFDVPLVLIEKRRARPNESEVLNVVGDVDGRDVLIVDDMIDTAGTLCNGAQSFKDRGAQRVFALAPHGVFSGKAIERIENSSLEKVFVTDSIARTVVPSKVQVISVASLLGEAIWRIHTDQSVSSLFEE
jgi:ribose-phosphate pyrophosphokinase